MSDNKKAARDRVFIVLTAKQIERDQLMAWADHHHDRWAEKHGYNHEQAHSHWESYGIAQGRATTLTLDIIKLLEIGKRLSA